MLPPCYQVLTAFPKISTENSSFLIVNHKKDILARRTPANQTRHDWRNIYQAPRIKNKGENYKPQDNTDNPFNKLVQLVVLAQPNVPNVQAQRSP